MSRDGPSNPEWVARTQVKLVRWMGMGVGVFLVLLGAFLAVTGGVVLAVVAFGPQTKPPPSFLVPLEAGSVAVGFAVVVYGLSLFRRARRDAVVTATVTLDPKVPGQRPLAWTAFVFGGFMLVVTMALAANATQRGESPLSALGGLVFVGVFLGAWRYLSRPP